VLQERSPLVISGEKTLTPSNPLERPTDRPCHDDDYGSNPNMQYPFGAKHFTAHLTPHVQWPRIIRCVHRRPSAFLSYVTMPSCQEFQLHPQCFSSLISIEEHGPSSFYSQTLIRIDTYTHLI